MKAELSRGTSRDGRKTGFANFSACAAQRAAPQMLPASRPHYVVMEMGHFIFNLLFHLLIYFYRYFFSRFRKPRSRSCLLGRAEKHLRRNRVCSCESDSEHAPNQPTFRMILLQSLLLVLLLTILFYWCYQYYLYLLLTMLLLLCNGIVLYFATNHIILYHIILLCKTLQCIWHFYSSVFCELILNLPFVTFHTFSTLCNVQ